MGRKVYKAVGSKVLPNLVSNARVILYDDENIQYITGCCASFEWEPQYMTFESMDGTKTPFDLGATITLSVNNGECLDNVKLDDTLMKRIAKFNKEQECKRLDEEINEKKEKIKELDNILTDRDKRVERLKKYIAEIYDMDIADDDWDE